MRTHTVVTYYKSPKGGVVQHAYGPYTPAKAQKIRGEILAENEPDVKAGRLAVTACKMLDVDARNQDLRTY